MSFATETDVKAVRKRHLCVGCRTHIEIGQSATRWAGITEGQFATAVYHPDCREAEVQFNVKILGVLYGDEWCGLDEIEDDDRPWLTEKYPGVAARMGIQAALSQQVSDE